jgi:hypothetical protein
MNSPPRLPKPLTSELGLGRLADQRAEVAVVDQLPHRHLVGDVGEERTLALVKHAATRSVRTRRDGDGRQPAWRSGPLAGVMTAVVDNVDGASVDNVAVVACARRGGGPGASRPRLSASGGRYLLHGFLFGPGGGCRPQPCCSSAGARRPGTTAAYHFCHHRRHFVPPRGRSTPDALRPHAET